MAADKKALVIGVVEARLLLLEGLAPYIERQMKVHVGPNWLDVVRNRRDPNAPPSSIDDALNARDLDDYALLRIMAVFWELVFRKAGLKQVHYSLVTTSLVARNETAHLKGGLIEADTAREFLTAMHQLLEAVGDAERSREVQRVKQNLLGRAGQASPASGPGLDLEVVQRGILDQLKQEFETRNASTQRAGQALLSRLDKQDQTLTEIRAILEGMRPTKPAAPTPAKTEAPTQGVDWELRQNPAGTFSVWGTDRASGQLHRLALASTDAIRLLGAPLVEAATNARGSWVKVPAVAADLLRKELELRLTPAQ